MAFLLGTSFGPLDQTWPFALNESQMFLPEVLKTVALDSGLGGGKPGPDADLRCSSNIRATSPNLRRCRKHIPVLGGTNSLPLGCLPPEKARHLLPRLQTCDVGFAADTPVEDNTGPTQ